MKYVYCSGPLFSPEETASMNAIARVLEADGLGTFLPQRDGLERYVLGFLNTPFNIDVLGMRDRIDRAIFALDVFQIVQRCDSLVLNMNGRVPDEGAVAEAGMAFAAGKPVVLYKNDYRSVFRGKDNSMILGLSPLSPVSDRNKLPLAITAVEKMLNRSRPPGKPETPAHMAKILNRGEKIWRFIESYPLKKLGGSRLLPLFKEILEIE